LVLVGNIATIPKAKGSVMKLAKLSALSAAALLAGGISIAMAQSNPAAPSGSSGAAAANQGKCWDSAANQIKDKSGAPRAAGEVTTGSGSSNQPATSPSGSMGSQNRPAAAAGLPNC
jgi:hypothetical protein